MHKFSLVHLSDQSVHRGLFASNARSLGADTWRVAFIAEFDVRRMYLAEAYPSMHAYCRGELHLTDDAASKRIQAARVARKFPEIFLALEDGRLHLSAVVLLAPHLTDDLAPGMAAELLAAATHKTKAEIVQLLAERFPKQEPAESQALPFAAQHAPGHVGMCETEGPAPVPAVTGVELQQTQHAPGHVENRLWARVTPLSGERHLLEITVDQATLDLLRQAQSLLGHQVPSGDLVQVFRRSLQTAVAQFEKRKFAATKSPRPRTHHRVSANPRYIPADVKRAVRERDGDRCTYTSDDGRRCEARTRLEFDHIVPVARGGGATVDNLRLRCRGHNHYEAERTFGAEFMRRKLEQARADGSAEKVRVATQVSEVHGGSAVEVVQDWFAEARVRTAAAGNTRAHDELDVVPWLRKLGVRGDDARRAAAYCESIPDAPLGERLRVALKFLYGKPTQGLPGESRQTVA